MRSSAARLARAASHSTPGLTAPSADRIHPPDDGEDPADYAPAAVRESSLLRILSPHPAHRSLHAGHRHQGAPVRRTTDRTSADHPYFRQMDTHGYFPCSSLTPPSAFLTPSIGEAGALRWIRHVSLKANASKHKAMSYQRMKEKAIGNCVAAGGGGLVLRQRRSTDSGSDEEDRRYGEDKRGRRSPQELAKRKFGKYE